MDPFTASLLIGGGSKLLGGLFGGGGQETEYGLSPEAQFLFSQLKGELGTTPSYVTQPIQQRWGAFRRDIKEGTSPELEGLLGARLKRATAGEGREMGEASERHRMGTLRALAGLLGRTGTVSTEQPTDWGSILASIGGGIGGGLMEQQQFDEFIEAMKSISGGGSGKPKVY